MMVNTSVERRGMKKGEWNWKRKVELFQLMVVTLRVVKEFVVIIVEPRRVVTTVPQWCFVCCIWLKLLLL